MAKAKSDANIGRAKQPKPTRPRTPEDGARKPGQISRQPRSAVNSNNGRRA